MSEEKKVIEFDVYIKGRDKSVKVSHTFSYDTVFYEQFVDSNGFSPYDVAQKIVKEGMHIRNFLGQKGKHVTFSPCVIEEVHWEHES